MDVNTITQLINGVGFPIAACCAMGFFIFWDRKAHIKRDEETQQMIINNTTAITVFSDKMEEMMSLVRSKNG